MISNEQEWKEIKLLVPAMAPPGVYEGVINRLFELGAEGVSEAEESDTQSLRAFFRKEQTNQIAADLSLYLESLRNLFPSLAEISMSIEAVKQEDWSIKYRENYQPQKLTNLFYLQPLWNRAEEIPEGMLPILMEPGQAFGTGLHATTKLCLKLLERSLESVEDVTKATVLDVGTGTGILAIAAELLGFKKIVAIDNDPLAVEVARENCAFNKSARVTVSGNSLGNLNQKFEVVISNILLDTHAELMEYYTQCLSDHGLLILSGVLGSQKQQLQNLYREKGFNSEIIETLQEWMAVLLFRETDR